MKTKEELNTLKEKVETLNEKLAELTEEELAEVSGGLYPFQRPGWRPIEALDGEVEQEKLGPGLTKYEFND